VGVCLRKGGTEKRKGRRNRHRGVWGKEWGTECPLEERKKRREEKDKQLDKACYQRLTQSQGKVVIGERRAVRKCERAG